MDSLPIAVPVWTIWSSLGLIMALMGAIVFLIINHNIRNNSDKVLMIDKNDRWVLHTTNVKGKETETINDKSYFLDHKAGLLNSKGKALYVFSENKPPPMKLSYNEAKWLDSKSLMGVINNKLIQQIVKPTDAFIDMLIIWGAVGGLIAGIASAINLLITTGVLGSITP